MPESHSSIFNQKRLLELVMRKEDFIVGKVYESRYVYYYIGPSPTNTFNGIFQRKDDPHKNSLHEISFSCNWKEYKEPRKGTRWMNVYSSPRGDIYTTTYETKENANKLKTMQKIACIEVPWVEGEGL